MTGAHKECFDSWKANDGEFDCLNRNDEKSLLSSDQGTKVRINFTELIKCEDYYGNDGLTCGEKCIPNLKWCRSENSEPCDTGSSSFKTDSPELCSNKTL